jgi:hypothetical protein
MISLHGDYRRHGMNAAALTPLAGAYLRARLKALFWGFSKTMMKIGVPEDRWGTWHKGGASAPILLRRRRERFFRETRQTAAQGAVALIA